MPTTCPYGHQLGPRRVLVGWHPCQCRLDLVEAYRGHRTYQCVTCQKHNWTTICYLPYHLSSGDTTD
ncbi:hypothetical protein [Actinomadura alba]|uniref:Uncharacterized protein n=1 Tax=Actinomadura alba TaxID=406431 RepID=A0ABR7M110_9ACTN|nr:hypothetical protein [Actinomadura alba]MBC6470711.1 hypothetical protein [Actinomadura alba]